VSNVLLTFSLNFLSFFPFPLHCVSQFHFHSVFVFPFLLMPPSLLPSFLSSLIHILYNCKIRGLLIYCPRFCLSETQHMQINRSHTHIAVCMLEEFGVGSAVLGVFRVLPTLCLCCKQSFLPSLTLPCSEPMAPASLNTQSRCLSRAHDKHFLLLHDI